MTEQGPVLVITINRPRQRNAMTRSAGQLIAAAVERLDSDPGLSVGVLTGAGGTFCAGMDLKRFAAGEAASLPVLGFGGLVGLAAAAQAADRRGRGPRRRRRLRARAGL